VLGVIAGSRGSLIVDAGNSSAHIDALLLAMAEAGIDPPRFAALTHWHWDHVFGTSRLDIPTCAYAETGRVVAEMATLDWSDEALDERVAAGTEIAFCRDMIKAELPHRSDLVIRTPDILFTDQITIDLGDVHCQLLHVGGDHASDAVVVYVPEDRIVFLGDCFYCDIYAPERRYTLAKFEPLAEALLGLDATCYLAGHDPEPMSRQQLEDDVRMLCTIGRAVEELGDREVVLGGLPEMLGMPLNEDHIEYTEYFLAGRRG
jgi:glyoxylase-like metal-dependent hydrolase (beta-lactamase superfamily II)